MHLRTVIDKKPWHFFIVLSAALHCTILFGVPLSTTEPQPRKQKLFDVDLVPPPQQPVHARPEKQPVPRIKQKSATLPTPPPTPSIHAQPRPQVQAEKEATVSLHADDTQYPQYASYLSHLRYEINRVWQYPEQAQKKALEGELTLRFVIDKSGGVQKVDMLYSSGHGILDREAVHTIHAAGPFMPFPDSFTIERLNVLASFVYEYSRY
jgi:protein TonB